MGAVIKSLFVLLASPVPMPDGSFGVMMGTETGLHIRQTYDVWKAKRRYLLQLAMMRAATEAQIDLSVIDRVADYDALLDRSASEYSLRGMQRPPLEIQRPATGRLQRTTLLRWVLAPRMT